MENYEKPQKIPLTENEIIARTFIGIAAFIIVIVAVMGSFYIVPAGHRGVVTTFGAVNLESKGEGIHFKIPFVQGTIDMEVRTQKIETKASAASKDLQVVTAKIALNYHLNPSEVPRLYQEIGKEYQSRVVDPAIQEAVKSVQARFTAEELITKRPEVSLGIKNALSERLNPYFIVVDSMNIVDFQFSNEFNTAIEKKVTAEQQKLQAEMDLERIIVEKDQSIARAQAEAESLRLQKQQITPELLELRAIEKWNGVLPTIMAGDGTVPFLGLNPTA